MTIYSPTDRQARAMLILAFSYLVAGLVFGLVGSFQYLFPALLQDAVSFRKTRPLHVYLVISWIFTAAQAGIYYYVPRIAGRPMYWINGGWIHFFLQLAISAAVIICFFAGKFSGREYLEFPPWMGGLILLSWIPFTINFFATLRPKFSQAPVYIWSWSTGIVFFFITLSESYLWIFDFFRTNIVRDITVQWKALGSMVGSWNMLVYGTAMYVMEKSSGDTRTCRSPVSFFFYFLGLANLMFNWGHHTYIVPAESWVKNVAYIVSMTELLILSHIIWRWRKTLSNARKNYHLVPYRLLSFADGWIFINLFLAILISIPQLNYYTHGTHITVAHAMGATIGINTMLLFASVFYILHEQRPAVFGRKRSLIGVSIMTTNISLFVFWISLLLGGLVTIAGRINNKSFYAIMQDCQPYFRLFAFSGVFLFVGLCLLVFTAIYIAAFAASTDASSFKLQGTGSQPKLAHRS